MSVQAVGLLVVAAALAGAPARATGQAAPPAEVFTAEDRRLATASGTLHGTLLVPAGAPKVPVVFIHPGSGPTDRDGNSFHLPGRNNSLRLLAEGLAARGIASLRIDKRGVAGSRAAAAAESDLRVETFVDDAAGWLDLLKQEARFGPVVALGHSEGALIAALAAARQPVDGYVSLAGAARRGSDVLRHQLRGKLGGALMTASERILSALERGEHPDSVPPALYPLFRPSVQPYLISWFRLVPADALVGLDMPVLVAQGTADLQVDTAEAALLLRRRPDVCYLQVTGMNHVLKLVIGSYADQIASYGDSTLMVAPALLDGLADFVWRLAETGSRHQHEAANACPPRLRPQPPPLPSGGGAP